MEKAVCCVLLAEHGSAHERRQEVYFKDREDSCAALLDSQGLSRTDSLACPHTGHITPVQSERRCPWKRSAIQVSNTIAQTAAGHEKTFHLLSLFSLAFPLPHSARLSRLDPPELTQPGRPVRPETAAAGGRARGGTA